MYNSLICVHFYKICNGTGGEITSEEPFRILALIVLVLKKVFMEISWSRRRGEKWKVPLNLHYLLWLYSANEAN